MIGEMVGIDGVPVVIVVHHAQGADTHVMMIVADQRAGHAEATMTAADEMTEDAPTPDTEMVEESQIVMTHVEEVEMRVEAQEMMGMTAFSNTLLMQRRRRRRSNNATSVPRSQRGL